jgi:hypothetical protein
MNKIKLSENFTLDEFIDPVSYANLMKGVAIAQYIREQTGQPVTINNWASGGQYKESGYRTPASKTGSPTSEHRVFNGWDFKIGTWSGQQMFNWAVQNAAALYALGARRYEDVSLTPTWLHIDGREHGAKEIRVIDLKHVVQQIIIK